MTPMNAFLLMIDGLLIAPYRWFEDPVAGWFSGTFILAVWAVLLGELSLALAFRGNRRRLKELLGKTRYFHEQSLKARAAGDGKAYAGINRLANEAYGKSLFLLLAMGMGSLWPAFFAMAWLDERFGDLSFSPPGFAACYVLSRFLAGRVKPFVTGVGSPAAASKA